VDYRDPLGQAHERIARLEEELRKERAKNAPRPPKPPPPPAPLGSDDAKAAPRAKVSALRFLSLPLAVAAAIPLVIHHLPFESLIDPPSDVESYRLILGALVASLLLFGLEAAVRMRAGQVTVVSRLLLVSAGVLAVPVGLVAVTAGVTIIGIIVAVGAAILGVVGLVHWITRGSTT
jgi:hypothetical protein